MAALTRFRPTIARPLALALAAALALAGCTNPFKPATPKPPDSGGLQADYSTPAKVLTTLEAAMAAKGSGATAWIDAMAIPSTANGPGFVALQDPLVLDKWRISSQVPPPDPWNLDLEKVFFSTFVGNVYPSYPFLMSFERDDNSVDDVIDESSGTATLHRRYYIAAQLPDGVAKIVAIGYVDLAMVRNEGSWRILVWQDRVDPGIGVNPVDPDNVTLGWRRLESR
jgi:hypothetical protein